MTGKVRLANSNSVLNLTRAIKTDDIFTNNFTCDGLDGAGKAYHRGDFLWRDGGNPYRNPEYDFYKLHRLVF